MVFELTDTLISDIVNDDYEIRMALSNLFYGYEEGTLLLSASPELLEYLYGVFDEQRIHRIINYLKKKALVEYDVLWQTKVVLKNADLSCHEVPISFFSKTSAIQPPYLLCENLRDTKFFIQLCKEYFYDKYINTKNTIGGGGSGVADCLESIVNRNDSFCLCIVDSDIKYPGAVDGGTYKAICEKHLCPNSTYYIYKLGAHEIENLIPINYICQNIKDKEARKFAKRLKDIDNNGDVLLFYDIKDGIQRKSIDADTKYKQFAQTIYNRLNGSHRTKSFDDYIYSKGKKTNIFPQLCPSILDTFINDKGVKAREFTYCEYLRVEWSMVRKLVITFLCSRQNNPII